MSRIRVNLAQKPFRNIRPVVRTVVLLGLAALGLGAYDAWLYWRYFTGTSQSSRRLTDLAQQIDEARRTNAALTTQIAAFDLGAQNEQVAFLNSKIEARSFSWSALFHRLSDLVPADVRLISLDPSTARKSRRLQVEPGPRRIPLSIDGEAKSSESVMALIDALFSDPAFARPNLSGEELNGGLVRFSLTVDFLPLEAVADLPPGVVEGAPDVVGEPEEETR
ncbi:MAG TPA: PilN domain-containing protein [Thermoanaerobaculia bacterium]|nr:PilN domain-containing protein [Thermoanaerobaculia bacterium]